MSRRGKQKCGRTQIRCSAQGTLSFVLPERFSGPEFLKYVNSAIGESDCQTMEECLFAVRATVAFGHQRMKLLQQVAALVETSYAAALHPASLECVLAKQIAQTHVAAMLGSTAYQGIVLEESIGLHNEP